jgi:hypothetical protein
MKSILPGSGIFARRHSFVRNFQDIDAEKKPKSKSHFLLFIMMLLGLGLTQKMHSQTVLTPGDVAIITYDADNPDRFTFVTLVDLLPTTVINFTDNGFASPTTGTTTEGFLTFTVPAGGYTKGQTFTWSNGMSIAGTPWSSNNPTNFAFNASGDQLFAFQGPTGSWGSQSGITPIAGLSQTTTFITTGSTSASTSYQPASLSSSFIVQISVENGYFANGATAQTSVTVSNSKANLQALFFNGANWFKSGSGPLALPTYSITVTSNTPTITGSAATSPTSVSTTYGTASSNATFNVSGTNMTAGILVTPPSTNFEVSTAAGGPFINTITIGSSGTIASTPVFIRLKATALFGSYSGNIVLSSTGATSINVPIASSPVAKKALTVSGATASNKIYDGNATATITGTTAVGTVNGDVITISGGGSFANKIVGTAKPVTPALTFSGTNSGSYTLTQPSGLTANITVKGLTLSSPAVDNKVYDGNTSATLNGTLSGVIGGDDVSVISSANFASPFPGTGISVVSSSSISGADSGNYTFTQPSDLTANITEKPLTIIGAVAQNKVFDGNTDAIITGTLTGAISGDDVDFDGTGTFASSAVGTGIAVTSTATLIGADATNYTLVQPTGLSANISAGALTPQEITFNPIADVVYGDVNFNLTATSDSGLTVSYTSSDANVATVSGNTVTITGVGTTTITASQPGDLTYDSAAPVQQTLTITPKELTVASALVANKEYDGNDSAVISGTLSGVVGSDDVSFTGTGIFASTAAGNGVSVTSASTLGGADVANYTLAQPTGLTADITPKAITVASAVANNKSYDGNTNATISDAILNGIVGADDVTVSGGGTFVSAAVANGISVTAALALSGSEASNYTITQPTGLSANITPLALSITGLSGVNKVYDRTTTATLSGIAALSGAIGSDDVSVSGTPVANFNNQNVGTAKPVIMSGFILTGADAGNYTLNQPSVTADITPASVTINSAAAQNKPFDGTTVATITGTLSGVISPDAVTLIGTGTFASSAVGSNIAVTSTSTLGGADGGNYTINPQPTGLTANILAAPVVLANWTYEPLQGAAATPTPNTGSGSSSLVGMSGPGTATGMSGTGCGAQVSGQNAWAIATAAPGATNESSGARFNTSTVGYQNITFSWDQRSSNTAANTMRLQYTLDGSTWNNFTMTAGNTAFCLGSLNNGRFENNTTGDQFRRVTVDLSSITGANNNSNFGVRVVAAHYQATGQFRTTAVPGNVATAGTWRFDNVKFTGTELPLNPPTASVISGNTTICLGETANISVAITDGTSPYSVVYTDGNSNFTVSNYISGTNITVSPATTATYTLVSVTDVNALVGTGNSGSAIITVNTPTTFYADTDNDGFGNLAITTSNCGSAPAGFVTNSDDCDDTKNTVHPGAVEIGYNLIDDDCDGSIDEGFPPKVTVIQSAMCNTTLAAIDSPLTANLVAGAQGYRWRITTMNGLSAGQVQFLDTAIRTMKLTSLTAYAFNTQYKVEVAVYFSGFLQPYTTSACTVTTPAITTQLATCGQTLTSTSDVVYANLTPYATGYKFRITDPLNPLMTQEIVRPIREFRMNLVTNFTVQYGKAYSVDVAVKNTDGSYLPYGNICSVTTPVFPTTSLQDAQCDNYMVPNNASQIYAVSYPAAIGYAFNLTGPGLPAQGLEVVKAVRTFSINDFTGLAAGATYNVKVRLIFNTNDAPGPYGKTCSIVTPGLARIAITETKDFNAVAYPNPFAEVFNLDVTSSIDSSINIKVYDMTGRLLENRNIDTAEMKSFNTGENYPSGVYNVIVTQGENVKTLRVIKR